MDQSLFDHEGPWTEAAYLALAHDGRVEVIDGTLLIGPGASPTRVQVIERVRAAVAAALPDGLAVRGPLPLRLGPDCVLVPDLVITAALGAPTPDDEAPDDEAPDDEAPDDEEPDGEPPHDGKPDDEQATDAADEPSADADTAPAREPDEGLADEGGDRVDDGVDGGGILDAAAALMVIEVVGSDHGATDRSFKPQLYARSRIPYSLLIDHDGPFAVADMIIGGRYHEYARAGGDEGLLIEEPFRLELDLVAIATPEPSAEAPATPPRGLPQVPAEGPDDPARSIKA